MSLEEIVWPKSVSEIKNVEADLQVLAFRIKDEIVSEVLCCEEELAEDDKIRPISSISAIPFT